MFCQHCGAPWTPIPLDEVNECSAGGETFRGRIFYIQCPSCGEHTQITVQVEAVRWPWKLIRL